MRRHLPHLLAAILLAGTLAPHAAAAQVIELHAVNSVETMNQSTSWGGGLNIGSVFVPMRVAVLGLSVGGDYIREQHLGKSLVTATLDATLAPAWGDATFVPYVGGGAGLNWSGGQLTQWPGARVGLDAIAGVKASLGTGQRVGWKLEERFGYVRGFQHAYSTRLGFLFGL